MKKRTLNFLFLSILLFYFGIISAQEEIKLSTEISSPEVPVNKTVDLTIRIEWSGDATKYEIEPFDNPPLTNLHIIGSSSSSQSGVKEGKTYSAKLFTFSVQPLELGMSYIEPVKIRYKKRGEEESQLLFSNRIEVKVLQAVREDNSTTASLIIFGICLAAILITFGVAYIILSRKKRAEKLKESVIVPPEEKYLEELKAYKPDPGLDLQKSLAEITAILKRYISEKFDIRAGGKSAGEINEELSNKVDDKIILDRMVEIFSETDVYKFSGQKIEIDKYDNIYGTIESIIEKWRINKPEN